MIQKIINWVGWKKIIGALIFLLSLGAYILFRRYVNRKVEQGVSAREEKIKQEKLAQAEEFGRIVQEKDKEIGIEYEKNKKKPIKKLSELNLK